MGGGSSSQAQGGEVSRAADANNANKTSSSSKPPMNYMENAFIKQEARDLNIEHSLVAYAYQKQNTIEAYESKLNQQTEEQK